MALDLLITLAVTIIILAFAAGMTARNRSARPAVLGLGLAMIPVGLYLTGVLRLTINGIQSLIDWFQRTPWTTQTAVGIGLVIGGVVAAFLSRFLPKGSPAPRQVEQPAPTSTKPAVGGAGAREVQTPGAKQAPAPAAGASPAPKSAQTKGLDAEDAEIEALLRKRGIM